MIVSPAQAGEMSRSDRGGIGQLSQPGSPPLPAASPPA